VESECGVQKEYNRNTDNSYFTSWAMGYLEKYLGNLTYKCIKNRSYLVILIIIFSEEKLGCERQLEPTLENLEVNKLVPI
jgi:hypothetical protein